MRHIDILLTEELTGGREAFAHSDLRVVFHRWKSDAPLPLMEGQPWAFIDWVLPEMAGLELCRRFRAVDGLTLSLRSGECFVMLGHNGAGKSTLVNALLNAPICPSAHPAHHAQQAAQPQAWSAAASRRSG